MLEVLELSERKAGGGPFGSCGGGGLGLGGGGGGGGPTEEGGAGEGGGPVSSRGVAPIVSLGPPSLQAPAME